MFHDYILIATHCRATSAFIATSLGCMDIFQWANMLYGELSTNRMQYHTYIVSFNIILIRDNDVI